MILCGCVCSAGYVEYLHFSIEGRMVGWLLIYKLMVAYI